MSIGNPLFPDALLGISRCCTTGSGNPLYKRFSSVKYRTETERGASIFRRYCRRRLSLSSLLSLAAVPPPSATLGGLIVKLN
uniref:Uncharacterized protein n=1 Tax=Cucumis melo subsp. melo TaxID=412675 RepID=E5GCF4_CUCME|nr:hypothetical protein [Cucumis melo subsp. melo]